MEKTAIIVVSFDGYKDVWDTFFELKKRYWPDCPYNTYLISNEIKFDSDQVIPILTGTESNWCNRLEIALRQIKEKNVILLLEDYLIGDPVDNENVEYLIGQFSSRGLNYLRLINIPTVNREEIDILKPILESDEYGISLQPAIWSKQFLQETLLSITGSRSAWEFEVFFLRKCSKRKVPIGGCYFTEKNILNIHNGILQGKWFGSEIAYFKKKGITINTQERDILPNYLCRYFFLKRKIRESMSPSNRRLLKKILKFFQFRFVTNE